ncbi:hypothetical protein HCC30_19320 [Streptomyces sp. HNM0574]|nr:hypothetical protein [Streptomyces sp. HNM0574]
MSMSLDGFVASGDRDPFPETSDAPEDPPGAFVMGRRSYEYCRDGSGPGASVPCFVLTAEPHPAAGDGPFTFVTDGIESAVHRARAAAGDADVGLHGGAAVRQCLRAGLLDELRIRLVPRLLGGGIRLFDHLGTRRVDLERTKVIEGPEATQLRFRVLG